MLESGISSSEYALLAMDPVSGAMEILAMDPHGTNVYQLTHSGNPKGGPQWKPTADELVYSEQVDGKFALMSIDLAGTRPLVLLADDSDNWGPVWTTNSESLLFISKSNMADDLERARIVKLSIADKAAVEFHSNSAIDFSSIAIETSGDVLFALARNGSTREVWSIDMQTGEETRLPILADPSEFAVSRDGAYFAFKEAGTLYWIDPSTQALEKGRKVANDVMGFAWGSIRGTMVYAVRSGNDSQLMLYSVEDDNSYPITLVESWLIVAIDIR